MKPTSLPSQLTKSAAIDPASRGRQVLLLPISVACTLLASATMVSGAMAQGSPAASAAAPPAMAAPAASVATRTGAKLVHADVAFMKQAAQNGHAEIEGSRLAVEKATNTQVKGFAQQMVDDHTKAAAELSALAASKDLKLPDSPSVMQKAKLKLLSSSKGDKFDRRYADDIGVKAHEDTVALFQKAATQAKDPDVKAFASKTLPTLQHHLEMAREMKASADKAAKG